MVESSQKRKPIVLYDHLPGILAGYPALLFLLMALLSYLKWFDTHMMFWIGLSIMILWYVAFRFNLPKDKFIILVGLLGSVIGVPVILELVNIISPFSWAAGKLGQLAPEVNTGAWIVMAIVFGVIWFGNFLWSRTHLRAKIDQSGLTVIRTGGKTERFDLTTLTVEHETLDYLELFLCGVGSLSIKTKTNEPIFKMDRVIGLYASIWFPYLKSKLARIEELLRDQGQASSVPNQDHFDAAATKDKDNDAKRHKDQKDNSNPDGSSRTIK